jgi:hypothetical protein
VQCYGANYVKQSVEFVVPTKALFKLMRAQYTLYIYIYIVEHYMHIKYKRIFVYAPVLEAGELNGSHVLVTGLQQACINFEIFALPAGLQFRIRN